MASFNLVLIMGKLTEDPELHYTDGNGTPYANLKVEVSRQTARADGTIEKSKTLVDVVVWKQQAELSCQMLKKGSGVLVSGELELIRHAKTSRLRVRCKRIQFVDSKNNVIPMEKETNDAEA